MEATNFLLQTEESQEARVKGEERLKSKVANFLIKRIKFELCGAIRRAGSQTPARNTEVTDRLKNANFLVKLKKFELCEVTKRAGTQTPFKIQKGQNGESLRRETSYRCVGQEASW